MADFGLENVIYGSQDMSDILQTKVLRYNLMQRPQAATRSSQVAMAHKSTTTRWFTSKVIQLQIVTETATEDITKLEAIISNLRALSQTRWKDLTVTSGIMYNNSGVWEYDDDILTWKDTRIEDFDIELIGRTAVVSITFIADSPIAYGTSRTLFTDTSVSSAAIPISNLQGTFYLQYPYYEISVDSVTPGSDPSLTITNGFATLHYRGLIADGDTIVIDTDSIDITRNGLFVDYDGALPVIDKQTTAQLDITTTYSSIDFDINVTYYPRYI
jgi:hypothetical protein